MKININIKENAKSTTIGIKYLFLVFAILISNATFAYQYKTEPLAQQHLKVGETPNGLPKDEWQDIKKQIVLNKYGATEQDNGNYISTNIANGWSINYGNDGNTQLASYNNQLDENYYIGLKLQSLGYSNKEVYKKPISITTNKNKLTYKWSDNVEEIWINSPNSLEQWFAIKHKPITAEKTNKPLVITMSLKTNLSVNQNKDSLNFANIISYDKLRVWDSNNKLVPAKMKLLNKELLLVINDSQAIYPLTVDPSFQQQNYIKSFNPDIDDSFGFSVAISGDTMVIGTVAEDSQNGNPFVNNASNSGAAYVFVKGNDGNWSQEAYLKASNIDTGDRFGWSVAIDGNFLVVGARNEDSNATGINGNQANNSALNSGAAYVFSRIGSIWTQEAYIKASNTDGGSGGSSSGDNFGTSVAISGNKIVIGAPAEDSNATGIDGDELNNSFSSSGAAYIYERSTSGVWTQEAYLKASNTGANDSFGISVAISESNIIVGAPGESSNATGTDGDELNNSLNAAGAAYVFTNLGTLGGAWIQKAYLKASNTSASDRFGTAVSISGNMLVIGAFNEDTDASNSGAAYVFKNVGLLNPIWSQRALLKASNADVNDFFGTSVSISGNKIVVGASSEDSISTGVDGDVLNNGALASGAAYIYVLNTSNIWSQVSYLKSSNSEAADRFGGAVAISGESVVVGAYQEDGDGSQIDNNNVSNSGAAYAFASIDGIWNQQRITKASNIDAGDRFGHTIAMSETTLVVGAIFEDSASSGVDGDESDNSLQDAGAAYVFTRNSFGLWEQQAYLKASNPDANDWFGYSVAISDDTIVISARNERSNATGVNGDESNNFLFQAGAVYVFTRSNNTWSQQAYIKPSNTGSGDLFGFNLAVSGDTMVVGAVFEDSDATGVDGDDSNDLAEHSGAAYIFERDSLGNWSQLHYLKASNNTGDNDEFGRAVSISDDLLVVSANREDGSSTGVNGGNNNGANNAGAVYAFIRNNGFWTQEAYIKASNTDAGDQFGRSIAISGNTLVVGSRHEDSDSTTVNGDDNNNLASDSGAAYVFVRSSLGPWVQTAHLKPANANVGDWFGDWVAITGENLIVVGASREDSDSKNVNSGESDNSLNNSGAAYVFKRTLDLWQQQTYLKASNSGDTDSFGGALAISNTSVVIGASLEDSSTIFADNDSAIDSGAVYIFNKPTGLIFKNGFE